MQSRTTVINGWALFVHPLFLNRLHSLVDEVESLVNRDPNGFQHHPQYKFFEKVDTSIRERVPVNPAAPEYVQGNTLGKDCRHWRRVKSGLPHRYRLFFQFRKDASKRIVYAWLNDETTLRKAGAKTDVYAVFKALLRNGSMPKTFSDLLDVSEPVSWRA